MQVATMHCCGSEHHRQGKDRQPLSAQDQDLVPGAGFAECHCARPYRVYEGCLVGHHKLLLPETRLNEGGGGGQHQP